VRGRRFVAQDETEPVYWKRGEYLKETFGLTIKRRRQPYKSEGDWIYTIMFDGVGQEKA